MGYYLKVSKSKCTCPRKISLPLIRFFYFHFFSDQFLIDKNFKKYMKIEIIIILFNQQYLEIIFKYIEK